MPWLGKLELRCFQQTSLSVTFSTSCTAAYILMSCFYNKLVMGNKNLFFACVESRGQQCAATRIHQLILSEVNKCHIKYLNELALSPSSPERSGVRKALVSRWLCLLNVSELFKVADNCRCSWVDYRRFLSSNISFQIPKNRKSLRWFLVMKLTVIFVEAPLELLGEHPLSLSTLVSVKQ